MEGEGAGRGDGLGSLRNSVSVLLDATYIECSETFTDMKVLLSKKSKTVLYLALLYLSRSAEELV